MYWTRFRIRTWSIFVGWLVSAVVCAEVDHARKSSVFLLIFTVSSAIVVVVATRKHRARNYKLELVLPGVIRSPHGFEVHISSSRLSYVEGDHVVSLQPTSIDGAVGRFNLSEQAFAGWDDPFANEAMDGSKKREIANAVKAALTYLQLVDAGKIRPNPPGQD